jgi:hypothetical protein
MGCSSQIECYIILSDPFGINNTCVQQGYLHKAQISETD